MMSGHGTTPVPTTRERIARSSALTRAVSEARNGALRSLKTRSFTWTWLTVALNGEGLSPVLVMGEGQVGLVVEDAHGRESTSRTRRAVSAAVWVMVPKWFSTHSTTPACCGLERQDAQRRAEPLPVRGVLGRTGLPGAGIDPDARGAHLCAASMHPRNSSMPACQLAASRLLMLVV